MKVGIGFVNKQNAPYAGQEATHQALQRGRITRSDLVLAFCSGKVDAEGFFRDIQSIVGADAPIVGGSAIGTITNAVISYAGAPAGVLIMQAEELHYSVAATGAVDVDEYQAGQTLVKQLGHNSDDARNAGDALLLLFYDSVKQPATQTSPPVMNASPPLIHGITEIWEIPIPILGAGLLGDYNFQPTSQFCGQPACGRHPVLRRHSTLSNPWP